MKVLLVIDIGTSSIKGALFNLSGIALNIKRYKLSLFNSHNSLKVEQNPKELLSLVKKIIDDSLKYSSVNKLNIISLSFALQRSSVVAWNEYLKTPLSNIISWKDLRFTNDLIKYKKNSKLIFQKTGLPLSAHYSALKISYLNSIYPNSKIGTLDTFLLNILADKPIFVTEDTMAQRTMLYNINSRNWDKELCRIFNINYNSLPPICPSLDIFNSIKNIPINLIIGDKQATFFAYPNDNIVLLNLGTVTSILTKKDNATKNLNSFIKTPLYSYISQTKIKKMPILIEATINQSSNVFQEITKMGFSIEKINSINKKIHSVIFAPFSGITTPDWQTTTVNLAINWNENKIDQALALLENLVFFIYYNLKTMFKNNSTLKNLTIIASGGYANYLYILKKLSALLQQEIYIYSIPEATCAGAMKIILEKNFDKKLDSYYYKSQTIRETDYQIQYRYTQWLSLKEIVLKNKSISNKHTIVNF